MDRAEKSAWEVYPDYPSMDGGYVTQRKQRYPYIKGYRQAEKDLALTWEDIKQIDLCFHSVATEHTLGRLEMSSFRQMYEEVLRRFQEFKNNK